MRRPWIEVVEPQRAEGPLREVYEKTLKSRGALAEVHKIHSLHPESLTAHMGLYMTLMFGRSPLHRRERELIGVAVSRSNACAYCVAHHSEALSRYEKDPARIDAVRSGDWNALAGRDAALCVYAEKLTKNPAAVRESDVAALRAAGLADREILDAAQIAAYFNFVNRLVLGLGVALEGGGERGDYKY